jgi:hypothetical protein
MDSENILWEAEEGVPQTQDAFIQRFLDGRDSLIQREVSQRHGQAPCPTPLTHFSRLTTVSPVLQTLICIIHCPQ